MQRLLPHHHLPKQSSAGPATPVDLSLIVRTALIKMTAALRSSEIISPIPIIITNALPAPSKATVLLRAVEKLMSA